MGKVGALTVGEHFHVVDATGTHQLQDNPVAVGQGIDQILVDRLQHVVAAFPIIDVVNRAALVIAGIKRVVIAIDIENQLVKITEELSQHVHGYIDQKISIIKNNTLKAYELILTDMQKRIQAQIDDRKKQSGKVRNELYTLTKTEVEVQGLITKLEESD